MVKPEQFGPLALDYCMLSEENAQSLSRHSDVEHDFGTLLQRYIGDRSREASAVWLIHDCNCIIVLCVCNIHRSRTHIILIARVSNCKGHQFCVA